MSKEIIRLDQVVKEFRRGAATVRAVDGVSLSISPGEFVAVMGKSGSGKSTLLHLMSGLQQATSGKVHLLGRDLTELRDDELTLLRREKVGFVFQFFNLLPTLSALENVALPLLLARVRQKEAEARAMELLRTVGMESRAAHKPDEMSGGQMQRVAIARALVTNPPLLFADEPTGNLDSQSGEEVLLLLKEMQSERGQTIVMVTHDPKAAAYGDRLIRMRDGKVIDDQQTGGTAG
ncbi:putative ABC transport system ATP-binding protein [Symbiobacterium terraclitae]|uniref:ABC transport system ATP-binding protein n=1 Tax=Symbiobacterium terraclitae TaxID=557451 RepID=A0ABS4JUI2_9FIRM|nr:putative ABC transport system ATP-binding protein [Symbiobacterium terraclitae]